MFTWFFFVFVIVFLIFALYNSFTFQIFLRKIRVRKLFLDEFVQSVRGSYFGNGYFALSHQIILEKEYKTLNNRQKKNYAVCYNVVKFKTVDANWELFFHLVKEGVIFSEIMTIRVFPKHERIHSEGNIEKNYSRLNIFTNNQYLSSILESSVVRERIDNLLRNDNDILLVLHNNLHYKIYVGKSLIGSERGLELVKDLNYIRSKVYTKGLIGY